MFCGIGKASAAINNFTADGGEWNTAGNWSLGHVPTNSEDVTVTGIVTTGVSLTITTTNAVAKSIDFTGAANAFTLSGSVPQISVYGSLTCKTGMTWNYTGYLILRTGSVLLTSNSVSLSSSSAIFMTNGATVTLADTLTSKGIVVKDNGTSLTTANNTINCNSLNDDGVSGAITLALGSSIINCTNVSFTAATLTVSANTASINITSIANITANFGSTTWDGASITVLMTGTKVLTLNGTNTFGNFAISWTTASSSSALVLGVNQSISGTFTLTGSASGAARPQVRSSSAGSQRTITAAIVTVTGAENWKDINGAGAGSWDFSRIEAGNDGGNAGITFRTPTNYYITQSGSGTGNGYSIGNAASLATFNAASWPFYEMSDDVVYFVGDFTGKIDEYSYGTSGHPVVLDLSTARFIGTTNSKQVNIRKAFVRVQNALLIQIPDYGSAPAGIVAYHAADVEIDNNTIVGPGVTSTAQSSNGILAEDSPRVRITRNNITHVCQGIKIATVTATGFAGTVGGSAGYGNTIYNMDAPPIGNADGVYIGSSTGLAYDYTGFVISYNNISEWRDDGIDLWGSNNAIVEYNTVGPLTTTATLSDGNGIKAGGSYTSGTIIRYNYIHDIVGTSSPNRGITTNGANGVKAYFNLIVNAYDGISVNMNTSGHRIFNNTIRSSRRMGAIFDYNVTDTIFKNNISEGAYEDLHLNTGDNITGGYNLFTHDACIAHSGSYYTNTDTPDRCSIDPLFISSSDFHLQNTSPAINAGDNSVWLGTANVTDYEGNLITNGSGTIVANAGTVDIGAYEYQDVSAPIGGSFTINNNATATNSTSVTLNITCPTDSWTPVQMAYGDSLNPTNWETCTGSKPWTLLTGDGTKTVHMLFKDGGGNTTSDTTDSIILDTTGPTGSITNDSGNPTNDPTPTFNLTIADAGIGITNAQMRFSGNNSTWSSWEPYSSTKTNFNINTGEGCANADGTKKIYVEFKDSLGNVGLVYNTGNFTLDTTASNAALSNTPATHGIYTSSTSADITVGGTDVISYKYKLDSGSYGDETLIATHLTLAGLDEGSHTLSVIGKDSVGNWQSEDDATSYSWTIDTHAPERSDKAPSGILSSGTTSTTLALTTGEVATCKYDTTSKDYGDMDNSFATPDGLSHSATVSGLTDGGSYNYYVLCQDTAENTNDTDYLISFSIASEEIIDNDGNTDENTDNERDLNLHNLKSSSTQDSITLTWKTDHNTKSTIKYGTDRNLKEKKKDSQKEKKHKVVLKDLLPNTKYYFRIKATDGDDNSDSSSIHSIMTMSVPTSNASSSSNSNTNQTPTPIENTATSSYSGNSLPTGQAGSPNVCSYTVKSGDTLWSIAKEIYNDPKVYPQIIEKNKDKYPDIESKLSIGEELSFGCTQANNSDQQTQTQTQPQAQNQIQSQPQTKTFIWWNPFTWF